MRLVLNSVFSIDCRPKGTLIISSQLIIKGKRYILFLSFFSDIHFFKHKDHLRCPIGIVPFSRGLATTPVSKYIVMMSNHTAMG